MSGDPTFGVPGPSELAAFIRHLDVNWLLHRPRLSLVVDKAFSVSCYRSIRIDGQPPSRLHVGGPNAIAVTSLNTRNPVALRSQGSVPAARGLALGSADLWDEVQQG